MQPQNSGTLLIKRPFDLYEAVVLLDVYLSMVKKGMPITKAAETASVRLRSLATSKGHVVSDSYRSARGLVSRLCSLGSLFEGKESKSAPGTTVFAEVVSLYNNDRTRYEEILNAERKASQKMMRDELSPDTQKKAETTVRRSSQMVETNNAAELDFFQWLPSAVTASVFVNIKKSYAQINVLLIKSKALPQNLTDIISVEQVEFALRRAKHTFANKRLRNTASQLLAAYAVYLREKEKSDDEPEKESEAVDIQPDWIKFDFTNSQSFAYTLPVHCSIGGVPIEGKNWARLLIGITEQELDKHNAAMDRLYKESLFVPSKGRPYLLEERLDGLRCVQLSNGYWVCINYNIPRLMEMIRALCLQCGYTEKQIVLYGAPKYSSTGAKTSVTKSSPVKEKDNTPTTSGYCPSIRPD